MEAAVILKLVEILLRDGIPAIRSIVTGLQNDNPTLEEIEALHVKVSPLTEEDFE
jgi:hypothetical protein